MQSQVENDETLTIFENVEIARQEIKELIEIAKVRRLSSSEKEMLRIAEDTVSNGERTLKMRNWRFNL